jgi:ElaA protein
MPVSLKTPPSHCHICSFDELEAASLYAILAVRQAVFCVEQNCAYQDLDSLDQQAWHLWLAPQQEPCVVQAYARVLPPGLACPADASIGRVVSHPDYRGQGLGQRIMQAAINFCETRFPEAGITLSAQSYLHNFYRQLGFENTGDYYLEDDIPHQRMRRRPRKGSA